MTAEPRLDITGAMWVYGCPLLHETLLPYVSPFVWCPRCGKVAWRGRRVPMGEAQRVLFWDRMNQRSQ